MTGLMHAPHLGRAPTCGQRLNDLKTLSMDASGVQLATSRSRKSENPDELDKELIKTTLMADCTYQTTLPR